MPDISQLLAEANRLYDADEYAPALALYREAALHSAPTAHVLLLISQAADEVQYEFLYGLVKRYPDAVEVQKEFAWFQQKRGMLGNAMTLWSQMLETGRLEAEQERIIRRMRFDAAARRGAAILAADFSKLWQEGNANARLYLLETLASINLRLRNHEDMLAAIAALAVIEEQEALPSQVQQFIRTKIEKLRMLAAISAEREAVLGDQDEDNPDGWPA